MDKAFDTVFQTEVDAEVIARTSYDEIGNRFRYQCLCCGEEVYLAAADSSAKAPHFRHRRGNNDTDCERYLGQPGAVEHYISVRKHSRNHIGFCFNREHMTFELSLMYTSEEIDEYAMKARSLSIYTKNCSQPFFAVPINRGILIPDVSNYFTLNEYANDYYISIESDNEKVIFTDIIKRNYKLNIYRIKQADCHCKRNISNVLYTNYNYLAISEKEDYIRELINLQNIEIDGNLFSFLTQGKRFYAVRFVIRFVDYPSEIYFKGHELKVETSETMEILWPPVFKRDSISICENEKVYISSSFELIPHGNVASKNMNIRSFHDHIYEVTFEDQVTICEKNVESQIVKEARVINEIICEEPQLIYADKYSVPCIYDYYLFNQNGCSKLAMGSKVYLSSSDRIIGYKNGHVKEIILPSPEEILDKKLLINNIMKYHPQSELFEPDDFMDVETDEVILSYIEGCYRSGRINTIIKQYIKEGRI